MASVSTIRLFEVEPDLIRFLPAEERAEAAGLELPVHELPKGGVDVNALFTATGAFGAVLLEGMLLRAVRLGEHTGLRLLGPGDLLSRTEAPRSTLVVDTVCRATAPTRLALLGREMLIAARRWPRLIAGLHSRSGDQTERVLMQLMICQLPRVDDRILSLLWLLAESWGHVTSSGTTLPVALTHEALGGLVGARRPTVTLAIGELTARGAIVRQGDGWLLLRRPHEGSAGRQVRIEEPRPIESGRSPWSIEASEPAGIEAIRDEMRETVLRLREQHLHSADRLSASLRRSAAIRAEVARRRRQAGTAVRPRRAPSS